MCLHAGEEVTFPLEVPPDISRLIEEGSPRVTTEQRRRDAGPHEYICEFTILVDGVPQASWEICYTDQP